MSIQQPQATDKLNNPSHALSHRVFANDDAAPDEAIVVDANGNVGISTTEPTSKLQINEAASGSVPAFKVNLTTGQGSGKWDQAFVVFNPNMYSNENIVYFVGHSATAKNAGYTGFNYQGDGNDSNFLFFGLFGIDYVLNINGAGNVGIGVSLPTAKLHLVAGTANIAPLKLTAGTNLTTPEIGAIEFTDDGTDGHAYITMNVGGTLTRREIAFV